MATARQRPAWRRPLVGVSGVAGRVWRWIGKSWRNVATLVLLGLAAAVGAAAGWDQDHHPLWLVAAALIAALAGAAQLSQQAAPSGAPLTPEVKIGQPDGHRPSQVAMKLGATTDQQGTNFAVFCESGEAVDLCLFDSAGQEQRLAMSKLSEHIWNRHVPGVGAGQRYGYRVHGLYQPPSGHRFNPAKLLLDPYAKAIEGVVDWDESVNGQRIGADETVPDGRDSAPHVPHSVVIDDTFDWGDDRHPEVRWSDTVLYEAHVRGFTKQHPDISPHQRGTYAAMGSEPLINYLKDLGVTTLSLMTVHHFITEGSLLRRGLTDYWGSNPIGYFAPEARYSSAGTAGQQVDEFKTMVRNLHAAGIEVIIEAVFNHTGEGNHLGPHLCFRGIDNRAYYRLVDGDPRHYVDYSGCGNTLNARHPQVLALIMDSLRYWVEEMHVDSFRFDLAGALARSFYDVDRLSAFFDLIRRDPVISRVKLIAEPWDVGEGGYQVADFPVLWAEQNDRYRDTIRDFWRGALRPRVEFARRLTGSTDLYQSDGGTPRTGINFVTWHDGFTLHDLVSYGRKHNEANGFDNRDGSDDDRSWNCGVEGPSGNLEIIELRERQKRNFLTTLLLSAGVPLLLAGDERGRTQRGNNNPYCQDNETSWVDWGLDEPRTALLEFTKHLITLRAAHPVFRRPKFYQGQEIRGSGVKDIIWFTPDGAQMDDTKIWEPDIHTLGMFLNGEAIFHSGLWQRIVDDSFLLLLHAGSRPTAFILPGAPFATQYELIIDTGHAPARAGDAPSRVVKAGNAIQIEARTMLALRARWPDQ